MSSLLGFQSKDRYHVASDCTFCRSIAYILSLDLVEVCVMPGLHLRYPDSPVCVCKIELGPPLALESDYCIRTPLDIGGL